MTAEQERLAESASRKRHWKRWGPYLAERAWGTVREDYSPNGTAWEYFPHDHARSRIYRWTEDGLLGICDNHQRLCFAWALWNHKDPILKERLFGLSGNEGNHGEDVKEVYYYLDATPTNSYLKGLYKYPQSEYPYQWLLDEAKHRGKGAPEFELADTGAFHANRYFDVFAEYARNDVDDILIRLTVVNRGPERALLTVLPQLWFRNTWQPGRSHERKPQLEQYNDRIIADHPSLGRFILEPQQPAPLLFTNNETNTERLFAWKGSDVFYKDAFHECVIHHRSNAVCPHGVGTKAAAVYELGLAPGEQKELLFRLSGEEHPHLNVDSWNQVFSSRIQEADEFYDGFSKHLTDDARAVQRQAFAGLFWSRQYYHFVVEEWLQGDPANPPPPESRKEGRNHNWIHLFNEDVISMPDKWEYPWYAAWDLAFHTVAIAPADPEFSKSQLEIFLREWYMHPNGQIPAYEWAFSDVNPPVHAWAVWRVFKIDARSKHRADFGFLERCFHKLLMNFTWWVNRKDSEENNIFEGGFLGLDNIGVFDRSAPLPTGGVLEQSDGTAWMAGFCLMMLRIALELACHNNAYEDIASKFFEHFLYIANAVNHTRGTGLWDETDGFYYDRLRLPNGEDQIIRVRSLVGLVPLFACDTIEQSHIDRFPGFRKRMEWFIQHRPDLTGQVASMTTRGMEQRRLLAVVKPDQLRRILERVFDESEFLSPYGIRSLSRHHLDNPYTFHLDGIENCVAYDPAESTTGVFGGNSNWRGPVWFPMNFLLIESLQRFHFYLGESFRVELPRGSGNWMSLSEAARCLSQRLSSLFLKGNDCKRPVYNGNQLFQTDPHFRDYVLFYEYFHGDTGAGLGANHQTGWTGLVAKLLQQSGTPSKC
jgi:hypothetical protein